MGLGSLRSVPLALARELAAQAREQLARGLDPIDARKAAGLAEQAARARLMTFKECAEEYHAANLTRWRNAKNTATNGYRRCGATPSRRSATFALT